MQVIDRAELGLRDFCVEDIPFHLDYWFRSGDEFMKSRHVDPKKVGSEEEMKKNLLAHYSLPGSRTALTITHKGQPIGSHPINQIVKGDHAVFHAHIWNEDYRKKGIALWTYPRACQIFMERFDLKRILFKTPIANIGALRVKEKLGIPKVGEELINFGIVLPNTKAFVYELTQKKLNEILDRQQ